MFIQRASEDQDVIEIHGDDSLHDEDLIYHSLEYCWTIGETKVHYQGIKEALIGVECCFPLITLADTDIIVSPANVTTSWTFANNHLSLYSNTSLNISINPHIPVEVHKHLQLSSHLILFHSHQSI
jgi:hypothetical protein